MSKVQQAFILELPFEDTMPVCEEAIAELGWRVMRKSNSRIVCKEPFQISSFTWAAKVEIRLEPSAEDTTSLLLKGSIFGYGPIQSGHLKRQMDNLTNRISLRARNSRSRPQYRRRSRNPVRPLVPPPTAEPEKLARLRAQGMLTDSGFGQAKMTSVILPEGTLLAGRFLLGHELGSGSFGITYRARHKLLARDVAIKEFIPQGCQRLGGSIIPPPSIGPDGYRIELQNFIAEARSLEHFRRPDIVRVDDVFEENGTAYMVMEYIPGRTLAQMLSENGGRFPPEWVLKYGLVLAGALTAVHERDILHRDIKPANVMVRPDGQLVLIDFGTARQLGQHGPTNAMTALGTPGYAPLEQHGSNGRSGRSGPASDVYGLAATLYHLATGQMPPSAPDRALGDPLIPASQLAPAMSVTMSDALTRALSIQMVERPQSMAEFAAELGGSTRRRTAVSGLTLSPPPHTPPPPQIPVYPLHTPMHIPKSAPQEIHIATNPPDRWLPPLPAVNDRTPSGRLASSWEWARTELSAAWLLGVLLPLAATLIYAIGHAQLWAGLSIAVCVFNTVLLLYAARQQKRGMLTAARFVAVTIGTVSALLAVAVFALALVIFVGIPVYVVRAIIRDRRQRRMRMRSRRRRR